MPWAFPPTFVVGGIVDAYQTNAVSGEGEYYVVEADESDGSFLNLSPYVALLTNVEADHLDHYVGGIEEIRETFARFMSSVPDRGQSSHAAKVRSRRCAPRTGSAWSHTGSTLPAIARA